jgi:hypothetical protein
VSNIFNLLGFFPLTINCTFEFLKFSFLEEYKPQNRPDLFGILGTHDEVRNHAEALDVELGFAVEVIEDELLNQAKRLLPQGPHQTLQTPYQELQEMCQMIDPLPGETLVDLGVSYGRMGLVLAALYP